MIFISHSWTDKLAAAHVASWMRSNKVPYWIDQERLDLSRELDRQIVRGMKQSRSVLFLASSASVRSPWVLFELSVAVDLGRPITILPLRSDRRPVLPSGQEVASGRLITV